MGARPGGTRALRARARGCGRWGGAAGGGGARVPRREVRGGERAGTAGVRAAARGRAGLTRSTGARADDSARGRPVGGPRRRGARECAAGAAEGVDGGRGLQSACARAAAGRTPAEGTPPGRPPGRETGSAARPPPLTRGEQPPPAATGVAEKASLDPRPPPRAGPQFPGL